MEEIVFHHTLPIQLRFNDVDKFGHVNNTVYFSFYNPQIEMFARFKTKSSFHKTKRII